LLASGDRDINSIGKSITVASISDSDNVADSSMEFDFRNDRSMGSFPSTIERIFRCRIGAQRAPFADAIVNTGGNSRKKLEFSSIARSRTIFAVPSIASRLDG